MVSAPDGAGMALLAQSGFSSLTQSLVSSPIPVPADGAPDVSIIMPCLNERESLPWCIANAREALERIAATYGLSGEIVIADNGSVDGSQALAESLGARVVAVARRGYGAALIGGCEGAWAAIC